MGIATAAAGGRRGAPRAAPAGPAAPRQGAPMPSAPPAYAACCGRCESPS